MWGMLNTTYTYTTPQGTTLRVKAPKRNSPRVAVWRITAKRKVCCAFTRPQAAQLLRVARQAGYAVTRA